MGQTSDEVSRDGATLRPTDVFEAVPDLPADSFNAAVVDYPWEFDTANGTDRFGHDQSSGESDLFDTHRNKEIGDVLGEMARVVEDTGWVFVFADDELYPTARQAIEDSALDRQQTVYWDSLRMGMGWYHRVQAYPILTAVVDQDATERYVQSRPNIYRATMHGPSSDYHTQKPADLYMDMLEPPVLEAGERVIEPFAGTFPSAVVAQRRDVEAVGYEVNPEAIKMAKARVEQIRLDGGSDGGE